MSQKLGYILGELQFIWSRRALHMNSYEFIWVHMNAFTSSINFYMNELHMNFIWIHMNFIWTPPSSYELHMNSYEFIKHGWTSSPKFSELRCIWIHMNELVHSYELRWTGVREMNFLVHMNSRRTGMHMSSYEFICISVH